MESLQASFRNQLNNFLYPTSFVALALFSISESLMTISASLGRYLNGAVQATELIAVTMNRAAKNDLQNYISSKSNKLLEKSA